MSKKQQKKLFVIMRLLKPYLILLAVFELYLLSIPYIVAALTPCFRRIPGEVYIHEECKVILALDRFIILALIGFAFSILYLFFKTKPRKLFYIGIFAIVLAGSIVFAYNKYILVAESHTVQAPIDLKASFENPYE